MPSRKIGIQQIFLFLLFAVGAIALIRDTWENGNDFTVFWKGAHSVLNGESLYSLRRDGGMVFKYPPWILPLFIPFGFMSLDWAKFCWGLIEVFSLFAVVQWLRLYGRCRESVWVGGVVLFWGLWAVHALDGQIALVMLAIALWAWVPEAFEKSWSRSFILVFTLSTKVFSLFPLLQNRFSKKFFLKLVAFVGGFLLLSVPALLAEPSGNQVHLFQNWMHAATSGGALLSPEQIRGRYNPSLTSLILRLLQVPADQSWADICVASTLFILLGVAWKILSRRLPPAEAWLGWLALVPVIHPLPWWHLFVFSFPLAVVSLDRALTDRRQNQSWVPLGFVLLGVLLISASTEKLFGAPGLFLEMACAKSWGVLLCAWMLSRLSGKLILKPISRVKFV